MVEIPSLLLMWFQVMSIWCWLISYNSILEYNCDQCNYKFTLEPDLKQHILLIHDYFYMPSDIYPVIWLPYIGQSEDLTKCCLCKICGKIFARQFNFNNHEIRHTGETSLTCNTCGKLSIQNGKSEILKMIHSKEIYFRCEFTFKHVVDILAWMAT